MAAYQDLRTGVVEALDSFERLIAGATAAASAELLQERVMLVQAVNAYFAEFKQRIDASGVSAEPNRDLPRWRAAYDELVTFRLRYSDHIARWSSSSIIGQWEDYRAGSYALINAMRGHLATVASFKPLLS